MNHNVYEFKAKVWLSPGFGGWHFVSLPKMESLEIKSLYSPLKRRGWGSLPIHATIGASTWNTSIFPSKEGEYVLALKQSIRDKEKINEDDVVNVSLEILEVL